MNRHTQRHTGSVPCCPHNQTRCSSLRPYIRPLLPAFTVGHTISFCTLHESTNWYRKPIHTRAYLNYMAAHVHSRETLPTSAQQRTLSCVLAASGYACSSANTTCGPALFSMAICSGIVSFYARGGTERRQHATQSGRQARCCSHPY